MKTNAKKEKAAGKKKSARLHGVGDLCRELIKSKKDASNQEIADIVKKQFPAGSTSAVTVAWYRSNLKHGGAKKAAGQKKAPKKAAVAKKKPAKTKIPSTPKAIAEQTQQQPAAGT